MAPAPKLGLFSSSKLSTPVSGGHLACNPVIDLTATVGDTGNVLFVWRANDQLVSKHAERNQKALAVKWKQDGQFLAVGWSDGVVRLAGLESSKAVHHIRVCDAADAKIDFIAWSRNVIGKRSAGRNPLGALPSHDVSLDDRKSLADLPHELTFLEIETALPKISPLPVSGGSGDDMFVFSTTSSLEFVFRPIQPGEADAVHVMIVGTSDGSIHLSIYDSFVIGSFKYSPRRQSPASSGFQLCGHGSHPKLSTHALLFCPQGRDGTLLHLVPIDLTFVHYSPVNLSLMASKMTTLQNLLRYLKQTQAHMVGEWKSTRELPGRLLNAVKEDLDNMERGPVSIVQALCHTVATGHVFPPVKEWLVDSLAERGHKRWDKAVVSGLENLRSLVHENFLPALERCGIILSRLLGIARFHDTRESIGFRPAQVTRLMDIVSCLMVVAHKILLAVMDELEHFQSFSSWFRLEIDRQASSTLSDELTEKDVTVDNIKVLAYIQRYLVSSPLEVYFGEATREDYTHSQELVDDGASLLEMLDKQLQRQEAGQQYMKALPHISFLVNYLTSRSNVIFQEIAEAEKRSVRFGQPTELSIDQKMWKQDVHVYPRRKSDVTEAVAFTCIVSEGDKDRVYLFRTTIPIVNGISGATSTEACSLVLPKDLSIVDFKFLDENALLVLCSAKEELKHGLVWISYRSTSIPWAEYRQGRAINTANLPPREQQNQMCMWFGFSKIPTGLAPVQMEVQKKSNSRDDMPARVCLLGRDKAMLMSYALPDDLEAAMGHLSLGTTDVPME
ncbi:anaphase-promoting complex subunit 4 [Podospora aff. communis PSN243]|uniref:Anaphase-promoting complex subunit 4 n=1 Tax=Podospora aff. communis PSN243 TaxID=3040156 RepID=A0AAV9H855_9PEZI|nr:anaphase-promoting complex subunit 4 [Podospora aff. communis PSN243]